MVAQHRPTCIYLGLVVSINYQYQATLCGGSAQTYMYIPRLSCVYQLPVSGHIVWWLSTDLHVYRKMPGSCLSIPLLSTVLVYNYIDSENHCVGTLNTYKFTATSEELLG